MRWISRLLRRRPEPTPQRSDKPAKTAGQREAESARSRSRQARQEIQSYWPEVTRRATRLRRELEQNHLAEMFRAALEGGRH
ncbi:DUF7620 family protein [Streptomyces griseosporeus]